MKRHCDACNRKAYKAYVMCTCYSGCGVPIVLDRVTNEDCCSICDVKLLCKRCAGTFEHVKDNLEMSYD